MGPFRTQQGAQRKILGQHKTAAAGAPAAVPENLDAVGCEAAFGPALWAVQVVRMTAASARILEQEGPVAAEVLKHLVESQTLLVPLAAHSMSIPPSEEDLQHQASAAAVGAGAGFVVEAADASVEVDGVAAGPAAAGRTSAGFGAMAVVLVEQLLQADVVAGLAA